MGLRPGAVEGVELTGKISRRTLPAAVAMSATLIGANDTLAPLPQLWPAGHGGLEHRQL
jgi:hypothetical protein